jgi:hypothetical protein
LIRLLPNLKVFEVPHGEPMSKKMLPPGLLRVRLLPSWMPTAFRFPGGSSR